MKKILTLVLVAVMTLLCSCSVIGEVLPDFGEEIVTPGNTVVSGALDVELLYNGKTVTEDTQLFAGSYIWEPGRADYGVFTVKNAGTLAFKYSLSFECEGALADVLCVAVIDGSTHTREDIAEAFADGQDYARLNEFRYEGTLDTGKADDLTVAVYFRLEDGDLVSESEAAGKCIRVSIAATQLTAEDDSFDRAYSE